LLQSYECSNNYLLSSISECVVILKREEQA